METERTPEGQDDEGTVSTRSGSRSGGRRPPAPRPAHPRRSDPGTVELETGSAARSKESATIADSDAASTSEVASTSHPASTSDATAESDAASTGDAASARAMRDVPTAPISTARRGAAAPAAETGDTPVGLTTEPTDPRPTLSFGVGRAPAKPGKIYRASKPWIAALLVVPAIVAGLLLIRALAIGAFGPTFSTSGVIASVLGLASLPLLVTGLYGLAVGAADGAEQFGFRLWARPPLAYLLVGIAFVIAAGLAIS